MIKEFAVEPNCFTRWADCRYLIEKFGYSKGRLISRYPEDWYAKVKQECGHHSGPVERKKILTIIHKYRKKLTCSSSRSYDIDLRWIENAKQVDINNPFHAIIASAKTCESTKVLVGGKFRAFRTPIPGDFGH